MLGDRSSLNMNGAVSDPMQVASASNLIATDPGQVASATNTAGGGWGGIASKAGGLLSVGGTMVGMIAAEAQANRNIQALCDEKRTNVELFQTKIGDKMAADKISFFSSGLDYTKGTAADVIKNNTDVMSKELVGMEKQYDTAIANEKSKRNAQIVSGIFDIGSKALSMA